METERRALPIVHFWGLLFREKGEFWGQIRNEEFFQLNLQKARNPVMLPTINIQYHNTPCGEIALGALADKLCLCDWNTQLGESRILRRLTHLSGAAYAIAPTPTLEQAKRQLSEYFANTRHEFDIPLLPVGTDFQKRVWEALLKIPYGETRTYKEIALKVGNPQGVRAVAQAIGANGISIFIPCHRVIGSDHSLTGFAGGLEAKRLLLQTEGQPIPPL